MALAVYLSRCRGRVDRVLDLQSLASELADEAVVVRVFDDLFDPEALQCIRDDIASLGLDAVVLGGNSFDHYRRSLSAGHLRDALVIAGVDGNRVITANLLEQVALPHANDPAGAMTKARAIIRVAMLRARLGSPAPAEQIEPLRSVLVLGATTEGFVAAERLLQLGYAVTVVDRGDIALRRRASGMGATASYVEGHPNASLIGSVSLLDGSGWLGDFNVVLGTPDGETCVEVGGILLAEPHEPGWVRELRNHFRIDIDEEGRARSIDPATHPAETVEPGLMVVPIRDATASGRGKVQAADAAALALVLSLSRPTVSHVLDISMVDETLCGGCASCVKTCAFNACYIGEDGLSHVDVRRCRGCGKCVVGCPVGARDVVNSPHSYLTGAISELASAEVDGANVLGFLCGGCGYPAADLAGVEAEAGGETYSASFLPLRIPCGGRLDTLYVLEAFKAGFDAVAVFRCREGHCHNVIGNLDMDRRINLLRAVLRSRGIDDDRLRICDVSPTDGEGFRRHLSDLFSTLAPRAAMGGAR